jgi:hypothetical protein
MASQYDLPSIWYDEAGVLYDGAVEQFDGIIFTVQMAFGDAPLDTSPSWTDVTTFVRGFDINRGRSSEFTTYGPGTASIVLDNRDRRFDPEHTTGPYYGDLNPMVPIRVQTTYSGTTYTMFYGFVQGWPTAYNQSNTDAVASVTAVDATRLLANLPLAESAIQRVTGLTSPYRYWPMQTLSAIESRVVTSDYLNRGNLITGVGFTDRSVLVLQYPAGASSYSLTNATYSYEPTDTPSIVAGSFWFDSELQIAGNNRVGMLFGETSQIGIRIFIEWNSSSAVWEIDTLQFDSTRASLYGQDYVTVTTLSPVDGPNFCAWTIDGTDLVIYLNAVEVRRLSLSTTGSPSAFAGGLQVVKGLSNRGNATSHVAIYTSPLSLSDIEAIYEAGLGYTPELSSARLTRVLDEVLWPSAWRDIETGDQPVGAYLPESLSASRYFPQVDDAEQGSLFVNRDGDVEFRSRTTAGVANIVGLFDDSSIDLPFANVSVDANTVDAIRNNIVVNYVNGSTISTDSASVAAYGQATETIDARLVDDASVAQSIGDSRLARTKDPRTRITRLDVNVRTDPAGIVPVVAALDLSDDVTVSLTPTGVGDPLWRAVRVQGIQHTVTPQSWDVALYLAPGPINTNGPLLILDDDTYGELDNNKLG